MDWIIPAIAALVVGAGAGVGVSYASNKRKENGGKNKADELVRKAKHEASEIVLNAKKEATEIHDQTQKEETERRKPQESRRNRDSVQH